MTHGTVRSSCRAVCYVHAVTCRVPRDDDELDEDRLAASGDPPRVHVVVVVTAVGTGSFGVGNVGNVERNELYVPSSGVKRPRVYVRRLLPECGPDGPRSE